MSKNILFIALLLLAIVFAVLGSCMEPKFLSDLWSQLFWLAVGTLVTTFVLETILSRAARLQRQSEDAFAFRTFSANMMHALSEIVGLKSRNENLFEAALSGNKQFETVTEEVKSLIEQSGSFEPSIYLKYYLYVASGIRDLSKNYIRLFSANRQEMLIQYRDLNELANLWVYKDEFSEGFREYTSSLRADDTDRLEREAALQSQLSSASVLIKNTASQLTKLAAKNASGKSTYRYD